MLPQPARVIELPLREVNRFPRFRRHIGDIDALVESIRTLGLLQPIVVTPDGKLISGTRRIEALYRLGAKTIACCVVDTLPDAWAHVMAEVQENTCRKSFSPSEAARAAEELEPLARAAASRRERHTDGDPSDYLSEAGNAMDHVAKVVGLSRSTLAKAMGILEAAREEPERYDDLVEQMDQTGKVNPAYMEMLRRQGKPARTPSVRLVIQQDRAGDFKVTGIKDKPKLIAALRQILYQLEQEQT